MSNRDSNHAPERFFNADGERPRFRQAEGLMRPACRAVPGLWVSRIDLPHSSRLTDRYPDMGPVELFILTGAIDRTIDRS